MPSHYGGGYGNAYMKGGSGLTKGGMRHGGGRGILGLSRAHTSPKGIMGLNNRTLSRRGMAVSSNAKHVRGLMTGSYMGLTGLPKSRLKSGGKAYGGNRGSKHHMGTHKKSVGKVGY